MLVSEMVHALSALRLAHWHRKPLWLLMARPYTMLRSWLCSALVKLHNTPEAPHAIAHACHILLRRAKEEAEKRDREERQRKAEEARQKKKVEEARLKV